MDETGSSLTHLDGPPLEEVAGSAEERELEVGRRIEQIPGVHGGEGGEVGVFNINHLGGHRYAGVMLVSTHILLALTVYIARQADEGVRRQVPGSD